MIYFMFDHRKRERDRDIIYKHGHDDTTRALNHRIETEKLTRSSSCDRQLEAIAMAHRI